MHKNILLVVSFLIPYLNFTPSLYSQECESHQVTVGYQTFNYAGGITGYPTESKPESKLWWNDGSWWGILWDPDVLRHRIHKFDVENQCWHSVGPNLDDRSQSSADVLWDESVQKLYISSRAKEDQKKKYPQNARFYRYSYSISTKSYSLDSGFPVNIKHKKSEALVIAKDSSGQIWATWQESVNIMVNRTLGDDRTWGTPFVLPVQGANVIIDDISTIIAFGGDKIGIMWSNQGVKKIYFAVHLDSKDDMDWEPRETALYNPDLGAVADDHLNLALACSDGGTIVSATKTSLSGDDAPLIYFLKRDLNGVWSNRVFSLGKHKHTRPIVLVNSDNDSVYVIAKVKTNPIKIFMKRTHISMPGFKDGFGEVFIHSNSNKNMNDPTSTKQCVNAQTGLLVLVSDKTTKNYLHNYLEFSGTAPDITSFTPTSGVVGTEVTLTGSSFTDATDVSFNGVSVSSFTVDSDTQIRTMVPSSATTGKISVTNSAGTSSSDDDFTVILPSEITSFTPISGSFGTDVTIAGSNFVEVSEVAFNGIPASVFIVDSKTQIRTKVPSGASTGTIGVTNSAGTGVSENIFTITFEPNITSFSPNSGAVGAEVTLSQIHRLNFFSQIFKF